MPVYQNLNCVYQSHYTGGHILIHVHVQHMKVIYSCPLVDVLVYTTHVTHFVSIHKCSCIERYQCSSTGGCSYLI